MSPVESEVLQLVPPEQAGSLSCHNCQHQILCLPFILDSNTNITDHGQLLSRVCLGKNLQLLELEMWEEVFVLLLRHNCVCCPVSSSLVSDLASIKRGTLIGGVARPSTVYNGRDLSPSDSGSWLCVVVTYFVPRPGLLELFRHG